MENKTFQKNDNISSKQNISKEPLELLNFSLENLLSNLKNNDKILSTNISTNIKNSTIYEEDTISFQDESQILKINKYIPTYDNILHSKEKLSREKNNESKKEIIEKINNLKNITKKSKEDLLTYKNNVSQMIKVIIEVINKKQIQIINRYEKRIMKINAINKNLKNIINKNKEEKQNMKKSYNKIISNLEEEKNGLNQDKNVYINRFNELTEAKDLLNNEKNNLQKQSMNLTEENKKLNDENESLKKEIKKYKQELENNNQKLIEYKKKFDEYENVIQNNKISLKSLDEKRNKIKELDTKLNEYKILNDDLKLKNDKLINENTIIKKEVEKISKEKISYIKELNLKKDLLSKLRDNNTQINKEKDDLIKQKDTMNLEMSELKSKFKRTIQMNKIKIENSDIASDNIHKLKMSINLLNKEKNDLEEKYIELIEKMKLKEKNDKIYKTLLKKEKKIKTFSDLQKVKIDSLIIKRKKINQFKKIISPKNNLAYIRKNHTKNQNSMSLSHLTGKTKGKNLIINQKINIKKNQIKKSHNKNHDNSGFHKYSNLLINCKCNSYDKK